MFQTQLKTQQILRPKPILLCLITAIAAIAAIALTTVIRHYILRSNIYQTISQIGDDFFGGIIYVLIVLPICFWLLNAYKKAGSVLLNVLRLPILIKLLCFLVSIGKAVFAISYLVMNPHNSILLLILYPLTVLSDALIIIFFSQLRTDIKEKGIWDQAYLYKWESIKSYAWKDSRIPRFSKLVIDYPELRFKFRKKAQAVYIPTKYRTEVEIIIAQKLNY